MQFYRVFVEKKEGFRNEAMELLHDLKETLGLPALESLRYFNIYEINQVDQTQFDDISSHVFSEENLDDLTSEAPATAGFQLVWEALPGQFDQRSDSAAQCIRLLYPRWQGSVKSGRMIQLEGKLSAEDKAKITQYLINPLESQPKDLAKKSLETLDAQVTALQNFDGFISLDSKGLEALRQELGMAMTLADLEHIQNYFKTEEKRDPSETELKVLDTYWSDHCRHTTFETELAKVDLPQGEFAQVFEQAWKDYQDVRADLKRQEKPMTLMDLATLAGREMRAKGELDDMEVSEEINACSVKIDVEVEGKKEPWLLMFKNETHNHPTEIEPFGGASTCIGGAIRDPLSGRSYVYQAMRITGSGDPTVALEDTLEGKLPQKVITRGAAKGYSSYGNQIGLATSMVREIYHPGYQAKRMEVGAVVGAAPLEWVRRESPAAGDQIILLGGKTGRDGCGGATGSSKAHTEESLASCGAEVQKGNAPEERKIQRLFRNPEVTALIKKCNDFGAGGVSVAIGELSDGLEIFMDKVPVKYLGLNGTELAISESQERMAVVVAPDDVDTFRSLADVENLESSVVATVTEEKRLKIYWRDKILVDLDRAFLDTNGVRSQAHASIEGPDADVDPFQRDVAGSSLEEKFLNNLKELNVCSQRGLVEMFDSTVGAGTVFMPYGGKRQLTETDCSVHRIPHPEKETPTSSLMAHGFNPQISSWSPFHGSQYAVIESITRLAATGGDWQKTRLSFQEYFRRMTTPEVWGQPLAALLGALSIQRQWKAPAIGGKDSMSGSYGDLHVPPTLISFAVTTGHCDTLRPTEFQKAGSQLYLLRHTPLADHCPDSEQLQANFKLLDDLAAQGKVLSAQSLKEGGLAEVLFKGCLGNGLGVEVNASEADLFRRGYGSILVELDEKVDSLDNLEYLGSTTASEQISINGATLALKQAEAAWMGTLEKVFHDLEDKDTPKFPLVSFDGKAPAFRGTKTVEPRVLLPVFPGTNCEYDGARAFELAGAKANISIFKNRHSQDIEESLDALVKQLDNSQILMLSGGFSAGDEPDGSGKFIANILRNDRVTQAVHRLLDRDGLVLGICNGFQALVKSGLLPGGRISSLNDHSPTLAHNDINRHISRMVSTKVTSKLSPWLWNMDLGDVHQVAQSHGEGRFYADESWVNKLQEKGQICFQYVDGEGNPTANPAWNPNGSTQAIEGICSEDGRILGKMGHTERYRDGLLRNIPGEKNQPLFESGVAYFK